MDSLQQRIAKEGDTKRKVELLNTLSFNFFEVDIEKANPTTRQALEVSRKIGDKKGEGWALAYRGLYFFLSGILPDAREYFEQSLSLGQALADQNLQTYSLTQLGNVFRDKGSFDSAFQFYKQAERISLKTNDDRYYYSILLANIGRCYLIIHKPDSAQTVLNKALVIREQLRDSVSLADTWILIGNCYRGKDNFEAAERYYQKVFPITLRDQILKADYLQNMGEIYFVNGDFQRALENWNKVLTYHRKYQYKYALAELLLRMGSIFEEQGYFDLANEYLSNALRVAEKAGYQYLVGRIYNEQGWVYYRSHNFKIALKNNLYAENIFKKLKAEFEIAGCWDLRGLVERNLKNYDTSLYYHEKSLAVRIRMKNKVEISDGYFNLGEYHIKLGRPQTALPYYFKSLAIDLKLDAKYGISLNYNRIGNIYTDLGRFDSAKVYLDKSMELAIPISSNDIFRDNYLDMASYFERTGKPYNAIDYYEKYINLTDSIFSEQTAQSLASYRTLYDVERGERQIELLNKDNELNRALVAKQRMILYTAIAGFAVILMLAVSYYRFNRRLKKLNSSLEEKNEEIQSQSEELVHANETLSTRNREIAEQKEEIQAQAEELIESNQTISGINEHLEKRITERTSELKQAYSELDTFFYRSSHDFRRPLTTFMGLAEVAKITLKDKTALELFEKVNETAHNLDKMLMKLQSISDVGVQELIYKEISMVEVYKNELARISEELFKKNIRTKIEVNTNFSFFSYPALIKIVVENLIENAISFSGKKDPFIRLRAYLKDNEIVLVVEDNGQGIEQEYINRVFEMYFRGNEGSKGNGLGLYIVKKTADKLKARVELQSTAGQGTTVSIFFPPHAKDIV
jgi:signal transduction histidine kinase